MKKAIEEIRNKAVFTAGIQYSEKTIRKLAELQYSTFNFGRKMGQMVLGVALVAVGIFAGSKLGIVALAVGCIIIVSLNLRPKSLGDQISKQYNCKFPALKYYFTHTGIRTQQVPEETPYKTMICLIDDGNYLYFFLENHSAFMVDKSTVKGSGGVDALKTLAETKTGLPWKKPFSLLSFRLKDIREGLAMSNSGAIRDSGERLEDRKH